MSHHKTLNKSSNSDIGSRLRRLSSSIGPVTVSTTTTLLTLGICYVNVGRIVDALRTFEVMDDYDCVRDVILLNSLMSAICGSGRVIEACNYLQTAKKFVRPDYDTYSILMGCYPGIRFFGIVLDECVRVNDIRRVEFFWEIMLGKTKLQPTTAMCSSMIAIHCYHGDNDAMNMLDGMVYKGDFLNSFTYNLLFRFLIKGKKLWEASKMFTEMVLNGRVLDQLNCDVAVRVYLDNGDSVMAINCLGMFGRELP
ncbi:hypothetical protein TSUD_277390 [Trifolium subterraneum]|uniref:Pentatricopeptide repeat-containing protein n=1 Tax=Trifolium subterraneum TaxID=3900 RepID=A0A2Z6NNA1_TRISU|nr:hypothetical protein TSUD_277390 [Trifolium subterraneum]